jgi:signal transduction histidine kinase/FixJ family two-component response regulator
MTTFTQKRFIQATKGKVIIGFLFACFALLMAWGISKFVFKEMLTTVEKLSAPNDRLRIVNELSHKISRLDQLQRDQAFNKTGNESSFITETRLLRRSLDTLSNLYSNNRPQLLRIKSIKKLLSDRDKQFVKYLEVRETLINTESFSDEVQKLNELVSQRSRLADSAVLTTETATSTTTVAPDQEQKSKNFLSRLFGKKKADVYKIINEEFKIKRDTLNTLVEDSIMKGIESSLQGIALEQRQKSNKFLNREAVLANSSNALTKQMLNIIREVEAEAVEQIDLNGAQAKEVVNDGIIQITAIIVAFFLITLILGYLILADITKSNRYRKALELAKDEAVYHGKAKQRFLSNMSHEIRTPLQSILGYAEIISQQERPRKKDVNAIYQSSVHLLQIVNEILDYNRIISGEFSFNHQDFYIREVLDEVIAVMRPLAEQKSIQLITNFDLGDNNYVKGDSFRLKQILFNLLGNAIKFTLKGHVLLEASCKQNENDLHFNFVVEDTGIGFAEEDMTRIFNEFEQIETLNQNGTGLGLAIVKSLIEHQDGRIYVKSKINAGTTFSVYLKYAYADEPEFEPYDLISHQIEHTGKVWVIDDDKLILDLCELIFEKHKINYKSFSEVSHILNEEFDEDVKYILIDMRLPEMSGLELCHLLKKRMPSTVKFYAITAQVLPDERAAVWEEGFNGIIMKPFRTSDLLSIFETSSMAIEPAKFDISSIEKMTLGDKQMLEKIINRFKLDSHADTEELKDSLAQKDLQKSRLIVHRLAGRIAQMGAKSLAAEFRQAELTIAQQQIVDRQLQEKILDLLIKLNELVSSHSML